MNNHVLSALMKTEFEFDRTSYLTLKESCYKLLKKHVPGLLEMSPKDIIEFIKHAGSIAGEYYNTDIRFDLETYHRRLESMKTNNREERKEIYLRTVHETYEQKIIMLLVAFLGIYAAQCDDDDDFWEPFGLGGRFLQTDNEFEQILNSLCVQPLYDLTLQHFDRRMAVSLSGLYSLAVSTLGTEEFKLHLQNFFHYIQEQSKPEMALWANYARQIK